MIEEFGELGKPVNSKQDFENFIDALFKIIYEGSGSLARIPPQMIDPDSIGLTIKHLRNEIRHDLEHGKETEVIKKKQRFSNIVEKYTGKTVYEALSQGDFYNFQCGLIQGVLSFLEKLKKYLIEEEKTKGSVGTQKPTLKMSAQEASDPQKPILYKNKNCKVEEKKQKILQGALSEEQKMVINEIEEFVRIKKRPPKASEPEFQTVIYAAVKYFGSWPKALKVAGVEAYADWRRKRTLKSVINSILNNNPLSLHDICIEVHKVDKFSNHPIQAIATALNINKNIKSAGARGHRIYYIAGQEPSIKDHPEINRMDRFAVEKEILDLLCTPMTQDEIIKQFEITGSTGLDSTIYTSLKTLYQTQKISRTRFVARAGRGHSAADLFGSLAGKVIYCRTDHPEALATYVHRRVQGGNNDKYFQKTLSFRLKQLLPAEVFELIKSESER